MLCLSSLSDSALKTAFWAAQARCLSLFSSGAYGELTAAYAARDAIVTEQRARHAARRAV